MIQEFLLLWENYRQDVIALATKIIASILIIILGTVLSKLIRKLIKKSSAGKLSVDENVGTLLRHILSYAIFVICIIMILSVFGVNTASLIALLGAAGVAVGLALKDTLGNLAAGIVLLLLGNYHKGEFVEFGSYSGTVKEFNLFTTVLETFDGIYISAPNSSIWGTPLKNYTRNGKRRMELSLRIAFSDSIETAFQAMRDIIAAEPGFLPDPAAQVILQSVEDSSVIITIRAWTTVQDYWDVYWRQTRAIKEKAHEAGLHIPFPQSDVRVIQTAN